MSTRLCHHSGDHFVCLRATPARPKIMQGIVAEQSPCRASAALLVAPGRSYWMMSSFWGAPGGPNLARIARSTSSDLWRRSPDELSLTRAPIIRSGGPSGTAFLLHSLTEGGNTEAPVAHGPSPGLPLKLEPEILFVVEPWRKVDLAPQFLGMLSLAWRKRKALSKFVNSRNLMGTVFTPEARQGGYAPGG